MAIVNTTSLDHIETKFALAPSQSCQHQLRLPPDTEMAVSNPASIVLAALVGQPVPTGETTSFIGNRG